MFYLIVSKLSIISDLSEDVKIYKICLIGSICYILLHAILFSNIGDNISVISKYRTYIYWLWSADALITGFLTKYYSKEVEENEEDKENTEEEKKEDNKKLTREETIKELKKIEEKSPFIKSDTNPTNEKHSDKNNSSGVDKSEEKKSDDDTYIPVYNPQEN